MNMLGTKYRIKIQEGIAFVPCNLVSMQWSVYTVSWLL